MKKKYLNLVVCLIVNLYTFSQITVSEIPIVEEKVFVKPQQYDSTKNWSHFKNLYDYKQYIGLQIYLPPNQNKVPEEYLEAYKHGYYKKEKFIFSFKPIEVGSSYFEKKEKGDEYFTILNVFYGDTLSKLIRYRYKFNAKKDSSNLYFEDNGDFPIEEFKPKVVFLLRDDKTGDSVLSSSLQNHFYLVPFFVKQKKMFEGKKLIYKRIFENNRGTVEDEILPDIITEDIRESTTIIDPDGKEINKHKTVVIKNGSLWTCKEVTLLKPNYLMRYILENDKGEMVALSSIIDVQNGFTFSDLFIEPKKYEEFNLNKKLQRQELINKQKLEELNKQKEKELLAEKHKAESIRLFGEDIGKVIAIGKVKIGFSKEMCEFSWGKPFDTKKVTTENGIFEYYYYGWGKMLYFENNILKRIEE